MNTDNSAPLHNPAASWDFGSYVHRHGEYVHCEDFRLRCAVPFFFDEETAQMGWDFSEHLEELYLADTIARNEAALEEDFA